MVSGAEKIGRSHYQRISGLYTTVTDWPDLDEETMKTVKAKIDTGWSIHLKEED